MRSILLFGAAFLLAAGPAGAKTYQLIYTGGRLRPVSQVQHIPGAKRLEFVITSNSPFPKNSCFNVPVSAVTSFTDGVDTIQTLEAAGYTLFQNGPISLCSDATGRKVVSWKFVYSFSSPSKYQGRDNEYVAQSFYPASGNMYDESEFQLAEVYNYKLLIMEDQLAPGTWKYKVVK
jgi:hypothetical protein